MGETAGDLISQTLNLGYGGSTLLLMGFFVVAVVISLFSKSQKPVLYWTIITLASTAGTTLSDYITRTLFRDFLGYSEQEGYLFGTILLIFILIVLFKIWHYFSKSNVLKEVLNKNLEALYWLIFLFSSTLGTAFGDFLAHNTPLGFDGGTLLLVFLLIVVSLIYFFTKTSKQVCYWLAIIFTHPIGATTGDYLTKPEGLNLGNINASWVLIGVFALVILIGKFDKKPNTY